MRTPSYITALTIAVIYYFAVIPLIYAIIYTLNQLGYPIESMKSYFHSTAISLQIIIGAIISITLLKKYNAFLLSIEWRKKFVSFLKIGFKWSIPILIVHFLISIFPLIRKVYFENHQIIVSFSVDSVGLTKTSLFSLQLILGAIAEELIFRGVILQKLSIVIDENKSVIIVALLFASSHFILSEFNIGHFTGNLILGLLGGYAFVQTRSCIPAIMPHIINNLFILGYLW